MYVYSYKIFYTFYIETYLHNMWAQHIYEYVFLNDILIIIKIDARVYA